MAYLICAPKTANSKIYPLRLGANSIGRGKDNSIVVTHESLSRHHAEIAIAGDRATLIDRNSLNGTFVNGVKINRCELRSGDLIACGEAIFEFVERVETSQPESLNLDEAASATIVKQFSLDAIPTQMPDLLQQAEIGQSVLKLRRQDSHQRALDKLKILLEVSKQLSSPEDPDKLLAKILDLLLNIMNVDRAAILLRNEATGQLESKAIKYQAGVPAEETFYSTKIANFVLQTGKAILTADAGKDERFDNSDSIVAQGIHASMCVPLKPRDAAIGVLYADNLSMSNVYCDEDVEFLTALANQAAIAIDNCQLYKQMQSEAVMRAKLECFFPQSVAKKVREEGRFGVVDAEVTVLFSDLSSFTEMSSQMEPRQVIEMLNEYFTLMVEEIVFPYAGTLEKYIGDALVAVWGSPYQQTDDAAKAVWAAIAMQQTVSRLNQKWLSLGKQPISIHIGLNTGKVAAGNIGSDRLIQYTHIGDTMNVASRICTAAQSDEILISQSTFEKLGEGHFPLEKLAPISVKGKDRPLQLYRLLWQSVSSDRVSLKAVN